MSEDTFRSFLMEWLRAKPSTRVSGFMSCIAFYYQESGILYILSYLILQWYENSNFLINYWRALNELIKKVLIIS
jgi:hypothetical protein